MHFLCTDINPPYLPHLQSHFNLQPVAFLLFAPISDASAAVLPFAAMRCTLTQIKLFVFCFDTAVHNFSMGHLSDIIRDALIYRLASFFNIENLVDWIVDNLYAFFGGPRNI